MTVFSLSVEDDPSAPSDSTFPAFLSCKGCGQLLGDLPLGAGLDLGNCFFFMLASGPSSGVFWVVPAPGSFLHSLQAWTWGRSFIV